MKLYEDWTIPKYLVNKIFNNRLYKKFKHIIENKNDIKFKT
jgi:hypothetical protein